jgi:hypothetical protein
MPPRRKARATPMLAAGQPPEPVWLESIVDAWSCYLADLLALRCSFFVRKGGLVRWVGEDPPLFDEMQPHCHSCKAPIKTRHVLCDTCRRESPIVEHGPTLSSVMQRSSNNEYVLDHTKKQVIRALRLQQELAFDSVILANTLTSWCFDEHRAYRAAAENATGNVAFDRAFVDNGGSYCQTVMCGLAESLVPVGGLGVDLRDQIMKLAEEWLLHVDKQIRTWFGIPISADAVEAAVVEQHVRLFAKQIANRVALLEPTNQEHVHASEILCVDNLEHRAEVHYVNEKLLAEAQCRTDCHSMAVLAKIARHGIGAAEQWRALSSPNMRRPLTDLLKSPPPELLKELRSVAQDMGFAVLRDILGNAAEAGRMATEQGVNDWRSAINVEALCLLFERATKKINEWRRPSGNFVETISRLPCVTEATRVQLRLDPRAVLPAVPWARGRGQWQLVPREKLLVTRTGLRPTGLRIVMLTSALTQLLGTRDDEPEVFAPGVISCDVLHGVAARAERAAEMAYAQLKHLIDPLMAGFECAVVKYQLENWSGSHLEDDIRTAARNVGRYSLQELAKVFDVDSEHWDGHSLQLVRRVNEKLVFKLNRSDELTGVISHVLSWALPLLQSYRVHGLGWSPTTRNSMSGALLELLPSVQQWVADGSEGALDVTRAEVRATSEGIKRLLEALKASGFVKQSRAYIGGKVNLVWRFNGSKLAALLAPHESVRILTP